MAKSKHRAKFKKKHNQNAKQKLAKQEGSKIQRRRDIEKRIADKVTAQNARRISEDAKSTARERFDGKSDDEIEDISKVVYDTTEKQIDPVKLAKAKEAIGIDDQNQKINTSNSELIRCDLVTSIEKTDAGYIVNGAVDTPYHSKKSIATDFGISTYQVNKFLS